jgi:hypothetical protein
MKCAPSLPWASFLWRSTLVTLCLIVLGLCTLANGQSKVIYLSPTPNTQTKSMTVADVIKLSKAGLSDDLIIEQIKKKGQHFDLSTDQLVQLKSAPVSERVIQVMIDPTRDPAPSPALKQSAPSPVPARQTVQVKPQDSPSLGLPTEIGVYAKRKGEWIEVLPEVVNWKTGGVVKNVASVGIVKGDKNGHVNGSTSRNRFASSIEFLIVVPEGVAITEYQLLRLHEHANGREFRAVTGGIFHVSGGATRDLVEFEGRKVASRTFAVGFPPGSSFGEYGFLPPGAFASSNEASSGKIYSFRVIE